MRLPVLSSRSSTTSPEDLVRFYHRARLQWHRDLTEEMDCPVGAALADAEHPEFNIVMDAAIPPGQSAAEAIAQVQAVFADHGGCRRWLLNSSAPPERVEPLSDALKAAGYEAAGGTLFHMDKVSMRAGQSPSESFQGLTLLPARAAMKQADALSRRVSHEKHRPSLHLASMRHLDNAHYDALIALADSQPAARVGVLAVGQIGLVEELDVLMDGDAGRNLMRLMLRRAMEIGVRSQFRSLFIASDAEEARAAIQDCGFNPVERAMVYEYAVA